MKIVLGVTGGIAAYKAVLLARMFVEMGHELHVIPTETALRFVGQPTWEAISGNPVTTSVHDDVAQVRHVNLGQTADLIVVAPATANTLARMAAGFASDLLGTTLLATRAPVCVAPAMHTEMWQHPATQANMHTLTLRGVHVIGPASGRLTGSDTGVGRMSEPEEICAAVLRHAAGHAAGQTTPANDDVSTDSLVGESPERVLADTEMGADPDYAGLHLLITAGGTREPIDPVRYLGNRSSGKQGVALAAAALERGAQVTLLAANIEDQVMGEIDGHARLTTVRIGTAAQLQRAATDVAPRADVVLMSAAVADYRVAEIAEQKMRKEDQGGDALTLQLQQNPDILVGLVGAAQPHQTIVGFAAETAADDDELLARGRRKAARKGTHLLAVNRVDWDAGFETATNTIHLLDHTGKRVLRAEGSKREVADDLLDAVLVSHAARANL